MHLLRCTACRITATVAPHKLTNIPISVQFVILYLISRNYQCVLEEQVGGHLLWLDVKYTGCLRLASARAGLLNNTGVRVVFVAVVAVFVLLFAGHLCLLFLLRFNLASLFFFLGTGSCSFVVAMPNFLVLEPFRCMTAVVL